MCVLCVFCCLGLLRTFTLILYYSFYFFTYLRSIFHTHTKLSNLLTIFLTLSHTYTTIYHNNISHQLSTSSHNLSHTLTQQYITHAHQKRDETEKRDSTIKTGRETCAQNQSRAKKRAFKRQFEGGKMGLEQLLNGGYYCLAMVWVLVWFWVWFWVLV